MIKAIQSQEAERLTDEEIKRLYQKVFSLLNERVFNGVLPSIDIDYTDRTGEIDAGHLEDVLACLCVDDEGAAPFILLSLEFGPDYGISIDDVQDLYHELIHYYCYLKDIEDTDPPEHAYHNLEFKKAVELFGGICAYNDPERGYNIAKLPEETAQQIFDAL